MPWPMRAAGRRVMRAVVRRLPGPVADRLRTSPPAPATTLRGRFRRALLTALRHGGIPPAVQTFQLADNPARWFASADSLVLAQLYWFGEQGWEPELLPWWRYLCRHSSAVLELGANVGYYVVQGMRAAPGVRYTAVEPHPTSLSLCRANLVLNKITSVTLVAGAAVADPAAGTARLLIPQDQLRAPTVAFVDGDGELPDDMAGLITSAIEVPAIDVRTLLAGVDLLKLDVEGQEHALLAAADDHLRADRRHRGPAGYGAVAPAARAAVRRTWLPLLCPAAGPVGAAAARPARGGLVARRVRHPGSDPVRRPMAAPHRRIGCSCEWRCTL
jgi:FkbM family methyltransferase